MALIHCHFLVATTQNIQMISNCEEAVQLYIQYLYTIYNINNVMTKTVRMYSPLY